MRLDLGSLIKEHRKSHNLTQKQLAEELDISYQLLQKYEYNKCRPSLEKLNDICRFLDIPIKKIFIDGERKKTAKQLKNNPPKLNKKDTDFLLSIKSDPELMRLIKLYFRFKDKFRNLKLYDTIKRILNM